MSARTEPLGPFDTKLWQSQLRATGRTARFPVRPGIRETYEYTLHDWEGITYEWDVVALQQRANGKPIVMELVAPLIEVVVAGQVEVDRDRVMTDPSIDPAMPLLAIPLPFPSVEGGQEIHIVADGWHRLVRAWASGRTEIGMVILDRADEVACRLRPSFNELAAALLPQIARRNAEREAAGQRRDPAYITADDGNIEMLSIGVCDFCRSPSVAWCYPANSFSLDAYQWQSVGNWGACEPCAALIEAVDLVGLGRRCVEALTGEVEGELGGPEPPAVRKAREGYIATLHAAFVANRAGPRHRDHPVPQGGLIGAHDG
jgi:hypothetical protein